MTQANTLKPRCVHRPHALLDYVRTQFNFATDCEMAEALHTSTSAISKIRSGELQVGALMMVRLHENYGISFKTMRDLLKECK